MTLGGQHISALEVAAFATGLASVWLARTLHVANWPMGLVSVACFAGLFYQAQLYADALLQLLFIVFCLYGWWSWADRPDGGTHIRVECARRHVLAGAILLAVAGTGACAWVLRTWSDSPVPWADAAILAFSLLATWAQARGWIESWWIWIGVDILSIPLYWSRALPLTAVLYVLFLLLCIGGLRHWKRTLASQEAT